MLKRKLEEDSNNMEIVKRQKKFLNANCPFTLQNYYHLNKTKDCLVLNINGNNIFYDIQSIFDYIFVYNKFQDPFSRQNFGFEHLDFVRYKAYKKGLIKGKESYLANLKSPKGCYKYDFIDKYKYIQRLVKNLQENECDFKYIKKLLETYFFENEAIDYFLGDYVNFPVVTTSIKTPERKLNDKEVKKMLDTDPLDCKFMIDNVWENYDIRLIFTSVFHRNNTRDLTIEMLDYICFKYNNYLNNKYFKPISEEYGINYIKESPYSTSDWNLFSRKRDGENFKQKYILRINTFLYLVDEMKCRDNVHFQQDLEDFWKLYYHREHGIQDCDYIVIPWCVKFR